MGNSFVRGNAGNDTITIAGGNNTVLGDGDLGLTPGDISDTDGSDDGNDLITTSTISAGNDIIWAGAGNDVITSGGGNDLIQAEEGDDTVSAGLGDDIIDGGIGNDVIRGGGGSNLIIGGLGDDQIYGGNTTSGGDPSGVNTIFGGDGFDLIYGDLGNDTINGDNDDDRIFGLAGNDTIFGGADDDFISGGAGDDVIAGGVGDDTILGGTGNDVIWGGLEAYSRTFFDLSNPANFSNPTGWDLYEGMFPSGFTPPRITPVVLLGQSVDGIPQDDGPSLRNPADLAAIPEFADLVGVPGLEMSGFNDVIDGGGGTDWIFGGGAKDYLRGGAGDDYLDGGLSDDEVEGNGGNDIVRGGANDDNLRGDYSVSPGGPVVRGDEGIDQLYGDGGSDFLFPGPAPAIAVSVGLDGRLQQVVGQRSYGGDGIDFIYAWAAVTIASDAATLAHEYTLRGDEMHGGSGGDWLYGNLRQDIMMGDSGNELLAGDYLAGPRYAVNSFADTRGANDRLFGGSGEDQLFGGGGDDELWGGADTDWLEGQDGNDTLYGGGGIDMLVADISPLYTKFGDIIDGHFGNELKNDIADDNATDILLVLGQSIISDNIIVGQTAAGRPDGRPAGILYIDYGPINNPALRRDIFLPWRKAPDATHPLGEALVEQIRIAGLTGDDHIEFRKTSGLDHSGQAIDPLDVSDLIARSDDYVGVIDGGPGDDLLLGTEAKDRIDGGGGSDVIYGFGGDDRLWGNSGITGSLSEHDVIFGGQGNDDLIGGPGTNELYAWTRDPDPTVSQLHFSAGQTNTGTSTTPAVLKGESGGPANGRLRADMHFALSLNGGPAVLVTVLQSATTGNTTIDDLVADINAALVAAGLGGQIGASRDASSRMTFTAAASATSLRLDLRQFGVFVGPGGAIRDDNGDLDGDGFLDGGGTASPYELEDTGLDRMLGSPNDDELYGGTGLGFLFGNGGDDKLFRADGTLFESLDGGLLGDEWKQFAKETGQVWYVGGSEADDIITVDYVTEPGFLRDHHLITRLTNNNGNYSFASQVSLDFNAQDEDGNPIWSPDDVQINVEAFQSRANGQDSEHPDRTRELEEVNFARIELEESLLPPEADFDVILIDALGGNDQVYVGPTVQKTVWIDAGEGDDRVVISSGSSILVDKAEAGKRNDLPEFATLVADDKNATTPVLTANRTLDGLTIDNPNDADWFRFHLASAAATGASIVLSSASDLDGLTLQLVKVNADGTTSTAGEFSVAFSQDATEAGAGHDTLATALDLKDENAIQNLFRLRGLSIHDTADVDFFSFTLNEIGGADDSIGLLKADEDDLLQLTLLDANGIAVTGEPITTPLSIKRSLQGLTAGKYYLRVSTLGDPARYELVAHVGIGDNPATDTVDERRYLGNVVLDLSGRNSSTLDLTGVTAGDYLLKVSSPNLVPTEYDLTFLLDPSEGAADPIVEKFTGRTDVVRRDVILGGSGNDVLQGGMGEDWIFGQAGNDVLSGGPDRQAEDLLFGGDGDDTFQIIPDQLPFIKGTTETFIPTLTDRLDGGSGDDRVLFLGGDRDRLGRVVPDDVAIRWNRFLHRYEFTALQWDVANQQFMPDGEAIYAEVRAPELGKITTPAVFSLSYNGGDFHEITIQPDDSNHNITDLAEDLQLAIDGVFGFDENGNSRIIVEFPDGILRLRAPGATLEFRADADPSNAAIGQLHFTPLASGAPVYRQNFAFFQTLFVEHMVIDTQAGDDVVHGNSEFMYPGVVSEWGIDPGDQEQRGLLTNLEIYGGDGNDRLFGGAYDDIIDGGDGADLIMGGGGDDKISGGPGGDLLAGNKILEPDRLEFTSANGVSARNDFSTFASLLPAVRQGTIVDRLNFHLGDANDWYILSGAEALQQFGDNATALLNGGMIEVVPLLESAGGLVETPDRLVAYLFPAEDTDPGAGVSLVPRERFSGVPQYYLLHVTNQIAPRVDPVTGAVPRGLSLNFDGVNGPAPDQFADYVQIGSKTALKATDQLTLEAWVNPALGNPGTGGAGTAATSGGMILSKQGEYEIWRRGDGRIMVNLAAGGSLVTINTNRTAVQNQWTHVAVTFDRGAVKVYVNGVEVSAASMSISGSFATTIGDAAPLSNNFRIGGHQVGNGSTQNFAGRIDDVRVWTLRPHCGRDCGYLQPSTDGR